MRLNVYSEELTDEVETVQKVAEETGKVFFGQRIYLESAKALHNDRGDDDRSAVTFWIEDGDDAGFEKLAGVMRTIANQIDPPGDK